MWILTKDGEGAERWLRPGKKYSVGRNNHSDIRLMEKTVSRNHAEIEIGKVKENSFRHTSQKTTVTIKDLSTQKGMEIEGKQYSSGSVFVLDPMKESVRISFGKSREAVCIKWEPVVISFSTGAYGTTHDKIANELRAYLEPMDIKLLGQLHRYTTHYLNATDKYSNKSLQALLRTIPIVTLDFAKALHAAMDVLEKNFKFNFPDPIEYLPNDDMRLAVRNERRDCFQGITFLFFDAEQRDRLILVLTAGSGKCAHYDMSADDVTKDHQNIVNFVNSKGKNTVLVKPPSSQAVSDEIGTERFERLVLAATDLGMGLLPEESIPTSVLECKFDIVRMKTARKETNKASSLVSASRRTSTVSSRTNKARWSAAVTRSKRKESDFVPLPCPKPKQEDKQDNGLAQDPEMKSSVADDDENHKIAIPSKRKKQVGQENRSLKRQKNVQPTPSSELDDLEVEIMGTEQNQAEEDVSSPHDGNENDDNAPVVENDGSDAADEFIPRLKDLAIIECTMPINKRPHETSRTDALTYSGRPNFKKFKKKGSSVSGNDNAVKTKIPLVEADSNSLRKASEVQTMFNSYNTKKRKHSKSADSPKNSNKRAKNTRSESVNLAPSSDEEDGLFMAPADSIYVSSGDEESNNDATPAGPEKSRVATNTNNQREEGDNDDDDDDSDGGYNFKFSRD